MEMTLVAYHGDPKIKAKYLRRVRAHAKADQLIKGTGWENGKGCAVGCTLHTYDHSRYPTELGIPEMLARLEDTIFEGLPNAKAQNWPAQFLSAIKPGADLSRVGWQFLHWLLTEELAEREHPTVRATIKQCADVLVPLTKGLPFDKGAAASAWSAAASAAASAASAAESAAASAESAAESAAWSAAESAAASAESAAWSAAESAAASAAYVRMSVKLLELLVAA
jgi:hypothetical protein